MGKKSLLKKVVVVAIIIVFFSTSILPTISGIDIETNEKQNFKTQKPEDVKKKVTVTCYNFGMPGEALKEIEIPQHEAEYLYEKIKELNFAVASDPLSERTQQLQEEIVDLADEYDLLPTGLSKNQVKKQYLHTFKSQTNKIILLPPIQGKASEFLCTFVSTGSGAGLPIIALPRLIPILMIPIPRIFMIWKAQEAVTSCGGLRSGTGFIAYGQQNGIALGFWGLGFTFSLPPLMGVYGLAGYAMFATVDAEVIEYYPPNSHPVISQIDPGDGEINVPLSLSELRFQISDLNGDLMSYTVTTSPDIGSGSGNLKPDGVYSIPISNLEDLTEYSWRIEVTDGMDTTVKDSRFTTEAIAPIVSNPLPEDDKRYVSLSLTDLSFHLKDFQGDPMDYTVETVPDIGSGSGSGVGDGTYTVPVSGLDYSIEYIWYVNATDGEHQTNKIFNFQTEHKMTFDPFDEDWQYRKEITIDYTKVDGDLVSFPVLVKTIDVDLRDKAQDDGDDILFMDGSGVANRLCHEIENFNIASGDLVAWVNVGNLDDDQDTIFYIYYGKSESDSQQAPELVWDSNFEAVYHMEDLTYSTILDSTGNGHTMAETGNPIEVDAKIGKGQDYEADTKMYHSSSEILDMNENQDMTCELWFNAESYHDHSLVGTNDGDDFYYWGLSGNDERSITSALCDGGSPAHSLRWDGPYSISEWYYIVTIIDRENDYQYIYINGNEEKSKSIEGIGTVDNEDETWFIGHSGNLPDGGSKLDGLADEIRISNTARDGNWISTSYNNQNNPSSFLDIGPEEPAP